MSNSFALLVDICRYLFWGIVAMALHEAGHVAVALMLGIKVKSFGINRKGVFLVREAGTPAKSLFISLAGPVTNLILMLLFWNWSSAFGMANFFFCFCNLAPIEGSDGLHVAVNLWLVLRKSLPAHLTCVHDQDSVASRKRSLRYRLLIGAMVGILPGLRVQSLIGCIWAAIFLIFFAMFIRNVSRALKKQKPVP
jgi:hypothetical protein